MTGKNKLTHLGLPIQKIILRKTKRAKFINALSNYGINRETFNRTSKTA